MIFFFVALSKESIIIDIQRWTLSVLTPLGGKKILVLPCLFFFFITYKMYVRVFFLVFKFNLINTNFMVPLLLSVGILSLGEVIC